MKKLIIGVLLLAGCTRHGHNGIYAKHFDNQYGFGGDTLIVTDEIITQKSGYHLIRDRDRLPIEYHTKQWYSNSIELPVILFNGDTLFLGKNIYHKIK